MRELTLLRYAAAMATGYFLSEAVGVWNQWPALFALLSFITWQLSTTFSHLRDLRAAEARGVVLGIRSAIQYANKVSKEKQGRTE